MLKHTFTQINLNTKVHMLKKHKNTRPYATRCRGLAQQKEKPHQLEANGVTKTKKVKMSKTTVPLG